MKRSFKKLLILATGIFCLCLFGQAESHYQYINYADGDIYFGHISYLDISENGQYPLILREGKSAPEAGVLNFPIAPGDTITTPESVRCEIQFDSGTIVRLDGGTELKIETILAKSLSASVDMTNLVLNRGQLYTMYREYRNTEAFQLIVPNASVLLKHSTQLMLRTSDSGDTEVQVWGGKASVLYGPGEQRLEQLPVKKSEVLTVNAFHKASYTEHTIDAEFYLWNQNINKNFEQTHEGLTAIPKPIQRLSPAVFNFAQKFSNNFGEWIWHDIYGNVWRPFTNDYYPTGTWQPYYFGQWREINGGLFWVPQESWGWVPYHLGTWIWNKKLGWVWLPGSVFAPAWIDWDFYFGYFSWRPISLFESYYFGNAWWSYCYDCMNDRVDSWKDPQGSGIAPPQNSDRGSNDSGVADSPGGEKKIINKNQLKQKGSEPYKVSKETRNILARMAEALITADEDMVDAIVGMPGAVAVRAEDLNRPQIHTFTEPVEKLDSKIQAGLSDRKSESDPSQSAVSAFRRSEIFTTVGKIVDLPNRGSARSASAENRAAAMPLRLSDWNKAPGEEKTRSTQSILSESTSRFERSSAKRNSNTRFRDWNPDLRHAAVLGVRIDYSSQDNSIRCDDLGLSSGDANRRLGSLSRAAALASRGYNSRSSSRSSGGSYSTSSGARSSSGSSSSSSGSSGSNSSSSSQNSSSSSDRSSGRTSASGRTIIK